MRHYYFRLILGIIFMVCMVFCIATLNIPFALMFLFFGGSFLLSFRSFRKDEKDDRE